MREAVRSLPRRGRGWGGTGVGVGWSQGGKEWVIQKEKPEKDDGLSLDDG